MLPCARPRPALGAPGLKPRHDRRRNPDLPPALVGDALRLITQAGQRLAQVTGITDENGLRYSTYTYDAQGRQLGQSVTQR